MYRRLTGVPLTVVNGRSGMGLDFTITKSGDFDAPRPGLYPVDDLVRGDDAFSVGPIVQLGQRAAE